MTKEEITQELNSNSTIQKFQALLQLDCMRHNTLTLVGGAVIDILEKRTPKDYDFLSGTSTVGLQEAGWQFLHSTSTADTYLWEGMVCQILKKTIEDFEFTISQSRVRITKDKIEPSIDLTSFNNKILIPCGWERKHVKDCLLRIPHYKKKGYSIPDETYLSLVRIGMRVEGKGLTS